MKRLPMLFILALLYAIPARAQISPDGSTITAPNGTLTTAAGTWSWGGLGNFGPAYSGDYFILRNGISTGGGGLLMKVANHGQLFVKNSVNSWYVWANNSWNAYPRDPLFANSRVKSQVHNAAGWIHSHTYTQGQRVNNGPGWNEANAAWVPYSLLRAYQALDATCVSAASGGPTGTAPSIPDGTCHWKYLSDTDYLSITGWANDGVPWTAKTYSWLTVALAGNPLTAYWQTNPAGCNSTIDPSAGSTADGCGWLTIAPVIYTSGKSFIPWQTYNINDRHGAIIYAERIYQAELWNDREYVVGQNGEISYMFRGHNDVVSGNVGGEVANWPAQCNVVGGTFNFLCPMTITAAPGESFADKLGANPSLPLTGPDQANGVLITGQVTMTDNSIVWRRLQMKNPSGSVLAQPKHSCNPCSVEDSIMEAVGDTATFGCCSAFLNDLIIVHGAGSVGVKHDYPGILAHSTVVNPEGNGGVCDITNYNWFFNGVYIIDTACFGFAHAAAALHNQNSCRDHSSCATFIGTHNFTDSPLETEFTPTSNPFTTWDGVNPLYTRTISGTTYSAGNASDTFVAWPGDYRLKPTSPLVGAGAAYGNVPNRCGYTGMVPSCPYPAEHTPDTDFLGTARPAAGQDVGAWQTKSARR